MAEEKGLVRQCIIYARKDQSWLFFADSEGRCIANLDGYFIAPREAVTAEEQKNICARVHAGVPERMDWSNPERDFRQP